MSATTATKPRSAGRSGASRPARQVERQSPVSEIAEASAGEFPAGMPSVWPFRSLPRRARVEPARKFSAIMAALGVDLEAEVDVDVDLGSIDLGTVMEMLAEAAEFFVLVAAPGQAEAMERWAQDVDDMELLNAFMAYQQVYPVISSGEGTASPSS